MTSPSQVGINAQCVLAAAARLEARGWQGPDAAAFVEGLLLEAIRSGYKAVEPVPALRGPASTERGQAGRTRHLGSSETREGAMTELSTTEAATLARFDAAVDAPESFDAAAALRRVLKLADYWADRGRAADAADLWDAIRGES